MIFTFVCSNHTCARVTPRLLRVCLVLLSVVALSPRPAHAEDRHALNSGLPRWLTLGIQSRVRSEGQLGLGFQENRRQDSLLVRNRLSLSIKPNSWLQFFGEGQDARASGVTAPNGSIKDVFDLRQAWVGLGRESGLWDFHVGRQKLFYGSERVIGAAEWGNTARVFDAARLSLHRNDKRVDVFAASVVENDADHWDHHAQGNNLHGA